MADLVICALGVILWAAWSVRFLSLLIAEARDWLKRGGEADRQKRQTEI
jgi:UTP:GlnB (protein PII) uridylyltransferase